MLKKLAFVAVALCAALPFSSSFRQGVKEGHNKSIDEYNRKHPFSPTPVRKFKNV